MFVAPEKDVSTSFTAPAKDLQGDSTPWSDVPKNALADLISTGKGIVGLYSPEMNQRLQNSKLAPLNVIGQRVKNVASNLGNEVVHPIESFKKKPISTALDLSMLAGGAVDAANLVSKGVGAASDVALPSVLKTTAGIPETATKMALESDVLRKPPLPEEMLPRAVGQPMIDAIKRAKSNVGQIVGKAYKKYAGMESPYQEVLDTPVAQNVRKVETDVPVAQKINIATEKMTGTGTSKKVVVPGNMVMGKEISFKPGDLTTVPGKASSYNDVVVNKKMADLAFKKGDKEALDYLLKEYLPGEKKNLSLQSFSDKDHLQILTRLKREIQQQTDFNKAPITLKPIDSVKDAALKTMASEVDAMRSNLPNGKKLAAVDNAWKSVHDIFDTVQRDLSDPGKAKDTMMRLLKQDNSWLSSGRMKTKVSAIRQAELLSGQKILQPAMEELTRQVFNEWGGKGLTSHAMRGAGLLGTGAAVASTFAHNPLAAAGELGVSLGTGAMTSPRIMKAGIMAAKGAGKAIRSTLPYTRPALGMGILSRAFRKKD